MRLHLIALVLALAAAAPAWAQAESPSKPVYVTSHVDVTPENAARTIGALKAYVEAARKQPGAIRIEAVQEPRPNHFDLIEVWRDRAAYDAHLAAAATIRFHDAIYPWRGSPFEERLGTLITP